MSWKKNKNVWKKMLQLMNTRQERPKYNTKQIATSNEREKSVKQVKKLLAPFIGLTNRLTTSCDFVVNIWFFTFIYKFFWKIVPTT